MKTKMTYHQVKKYGKFAANLPQAILLAVLAAMLFWSPTRVFFESIVIKTAALAYPGRAEKFKSMSDAALLERVAGLKAENEVLRANLNLKRKVAKPAKLVFGGGYLFADVLILSEGSGAGIQKGDVVFTPENILIGRVVEAGSDWSKVRPVSALGEKIVLRGGGGKELVFEAEGRGLGEMKGSLPQDLTVLPGEVLWWGENPQIIAALVDKIYRTESSPFYDIIMISPIKIFSASDVLVVSP